jgi:membrane-associated protease RseP (regulator of RpoE activity)
MKTHNSIKRLGALILTGSIAVFTAVAADTTTATGNTTATTPAPAAPATTATASTTSADTNVPAPTKAAKHHHKHHGATAASATKESASLAKTGRPWFGAIAKNAKLPTDRNHHAAPEVRITKVYPGSPAYNAGLRAGDVIWKFDGKRLDSTAQLQRELSDEKPGATVPVEIFHHGKREDMKVKLGAARTAQALSASGYVLIG